MRKVSLKRRYINEIYEGDYKKYLRDRRADYCKAQFQWACWIDMLCKDGEISQKQYDSAVF